MEQKIADFTTRILGADKSTDVWEIGNRFFLDLGYDGVFHGAHELRRGENAPTPQQISTHYYAPVFSNIQTSDSLKTWLSAYLNEGDDAHDPLFKYFDEIPPSFNSGSEFISNYPFLGAVDRAVIYRAEAFGYRSGVGIPMPFKEQKQIGGWNFLSRLKRRDFEALHKRTAPILHLSAALVHRELEARQAKRPRQNIRLSPREKECLLWLAAGLRTSQIAEKIGIKPVTVDMHMRNARLRLNAKTREQALAIALIEGHIKP